MTDVSTYDEALASSVDDDYGISPNTAERYIYTTDKRDMNSLVFFGTHEKETMKISEDDFPMNEDANDEYSPGYITGRIKSNRVCQSDRAEAKVFGTQELDTEELILGAMDDQMKAVPDKKVQKNTESVQLAETLSQKLDLTDQSNDPTTPLKMVASSSSLTASPNKPIDRKPLLIEYQERSRQENDKEIINLIVLGELFLMVSCQ
ncbi:hypothetical protein FBUS_10380 [Fasciolopsis buskii]|uniref:Uncharacterized protein n=1 Tax=Fasciolopsis buskii TaxID=27845 RepID=A0A8E0RUA1_9TREM|nr:hypothetical protein FBUS_10380 [Fasciolopsis buski]